MRFFKLIRQRQQTKRDPDGQPDLAIVKMLDAIEQEEQAKQVKVDEPLPESGATSSKELIEQLNDYAQQRAQNDYTYHFQCFFLLVFFTWLVDQVKPTYRVAHKEKQTKVDAAELLAKKINRADGYQQEFTPAQLLALRQGGLGGIIQKADSDVLGEELQQELAPRAAVAVF